MLVEMKNGETYDGHLVNCGTWMNIYLREVNRTSKDGQVLASAPDEIGSQLVGRGREEISAGPFKGIGPGQEDGSKGMGSSRGRGGSGSKGGRSRGGGRGLG